jgi:hypothetical protein
MSVLGLALAGGNVWFWWWVVRTGDARFRVRVERRYGVTIGRSFRGHWQITSGQSSALKRFAIELLQLAYFMGAFVVWGLLLGLGVGLMALVDMLW